MPRDGIIQVSKVIIQRHSCWDPSRLGPSPSNRATVVKTSRDRTVVDNSPRNIRVTEHIQNQLALAHQPPPETIADAARVTHAPAPQFQKNMYGRVRPWLAQHQMALAQHLTSILSRRVRLAAFSFASDSSLVKP